MSVDAMLEGAAKAHKAWERKAIAKVVAWRAFVRNESKVYKAFMAGDATREEWSKLWATAPPEPTKAEYEAARENGL